MGAPAVGETDSHYDGVVGDYVEMERKARGIAKNTALSALVDVSMPDGSRTRTLTLFNIRGEIIDPTGDGTQTLPLPEGATIHATVELPLTVENVVFLVEHSGKADDPQPTKLQFGYTWD